jgi:hypothetical protein
MAAKFSAAKRTGRTEAGPATYAESLAFEAPYLIEKLVKDHICANEEEARALFRELKRYFYLSRIDRSTVWEMYSLRIDEIWHQFVLFTRQYMDFCSRYYGAYLPHNPSNAPDQPKNAPGRTVPVATFEEFQAYYEKTFGEPLPDCWYDDRNVRLHRRVMDARIGRLILRQDVDRAELVNGRGEVVFSVNALAADALSFMADAGAFYVRELPGGLEDNEKVALVSTLVQHRLLRLAS